MVQDKDGSDLATIIMGQSKQYYLLKNKDKGNMEFFRRFIALSDAEVMPLPRPETTPPVTKMYFVIGDLSFTLL